MKRVGLLILLFPFYIFSQQEASNWYFGENAGIQFNPVTNTVTVLTDGELRTREGCASISDSNGNLLFYTDGTIVWDSTHAVMQNGTGLFGDSSSTQSAIIVPKPLAPDIYYIFTVDNNVDGNNFGFNYSEVDITLNGGLGAVTNKNVNLLASCSEKITAVLQNCQTQSILVITFGPDPAMPTGDFNTFYAYEVSTTGVNLQGDTTFDNISITDARGYLKVSPDGKWLANANFSNGLQLYEFDSGTGAVTNQVFMPLTGQNFAAYGVEFSPNNQFLYVHASNSAQGAGPHSSSLIQYDLLSADIPNSGIVIDNRALYRGGLQLGPDGKIYRALSSTYEVGQGFLGVIHAPNNLGVAANYEHNAIDLQGRLSSQGLPPFIQSFFNARVDIINNNISNTHLALCNGETYTLLAPNIPLANYTWTLDGNPIPETDFDLVIDQNGAYQDGFYEVLVEPTNGDCETFQGQANVEYFENPIAIQPANLPMCDDDDDDGVVVFDLSQQNNDIIGTQDPLSYQVLYFETLVDAQNNQNPITGLYNNTSSPQTIFARIHHVGNNNCFDTTNFQIEVFTTPVANAITNTMFCDDGNDADVFNGQTDIEINALFTSEILGVNQDPAFYTVTYHPTQTDANNNTASLGNTYYNVTAFNDTIFARIENNSNTNCFSTLEINLTINAQPEVFDAVLTQCDEDGINDGLTLFNLTEVIPEITNNATDVTVAFYLNITDAETNTNELATNYTNISSPQDIVAVVTNTNTSCTNTAQLTLLSSATQGNNVQAPAVCDELNSPDGINTFNLNDYTATILDGLPAGLNVVYYGSYNDALLEQNELPLTYSNLNPYSEIIYARIEDAFNACFGIAEVLLTVNPLPNVGEDYTQLYCVDSQIPLTLNAGIPGNPNNYTYVWSTGETTATIDILTAGVFTVTATSQQGCYKTKTITIEPSNMATIDSIDVIDGLITGNTVTVNASGLGIYEYTLLDINNQVVVDYQSHPVFTNILAGIYTVVVRDIRNNCGEISQLISVIGFPSYFTPNNDGYNDTWNVKGISSQFQPNTEIYIFNRYGKLLTKVNPLGNGWNGTFKGEPLPNDDYWFVVTLQDGRVFKDHFTLKR